MRVLIVFSFLLLPMRVRKRNENENDALITFLFFVLIYIIKIYTYTLQASKWKELSTSRNTFTFTDINYTREMKGREIHNRILSRCFHRKYFFFSTVGIINIHCEVGWKMERGKKNLGGNQRNWNLIETYSSYCFVNNKNRMKQQIASAAWCLVRVLFIICQQWQQ